jgi:hypothetical protein
MVGGEKRLLLSFFWCKYVYDEEAEREEGQESLKKFFPVKQMISN